MTNPWLYIPLADYEAHMALPTVAQAEMLAEELEIAIRQHVPDSCAIIGCAGGNGFEELAVAGVRRIVGIDLNPDYVAAARQRHAGIAGLELHVADAQRLVTECAPVALVFAGLVFEYVDVAATLATLRTLCVAGGELVIVLQGAGSHAPVTPSRYASLATLAGALTLRHSDAVAEQCVEAGFAHMRTRTRTLPSGKHFEVLTFSG
jgi:SAM-dependent methyltransferase